MRVMSWRPNERLGDLVARAFGDLNAVDRRRAEAALKKLNPHLANLGATALGALVFVPEVPGIAVNANPEVTNATVGIVRELRRSIAEFAQRVITAARTDGAAAEEDARTLEKLVTPAAPPPQLEEVRQALRGRIQRSKEVLDSAEPRLAALDKALEALAGKLAG